MAKSRAGAIMEISHPTLATNPLSVVMILAFLEHVILSTEMLEADDIDIYLQP